VPRSEARALAAFAKQRASLRGVELGHESLWFDCGETFWKLSPGDWQKRQSPNGSKWTKTTAAGTEYFPRRRPLNTSVSRKWLNLC